MDIVRHPVLDEFVEFLTTQPSLEDVLNFQHSAATQSRISDLLDANKNRRLTDSEFEELNELEHLEHIVRAAKIRAAKKLHLING